MRAASPLLLLMACGGSSGVSSGDVRALPAALAAVQADPASAIEHCAPVQTPAHHADCLTLGAELLAPDDASAAGALCAELEGVGADECRFQVAERAKRPELCAAAGRFADDCRMHAWSRAVPELAEDSVSFAEWEPVLAAGAVEAGFSPEDPRPWVAASRHLLGRQLPLDRSQCQGWSSPAREHCRAAGEGLLHDRLNHVRDRKRWRCDGPVPELLTFTEDSELQAVFDERTAREICP